MSRIFSGKLPHRACRVALEIEQKQLIDFINNEKRRLTHTKNEIRDMTQAFRERADRFRAVFDAAWTALLNPSQEKLTALREALDRADHCWEGFAGCVYDPEPRAELKAAQTRYAIKKRSERIEQARKKLVDHGLIDDPRRTNFIGGQ
jgi:hypothetical protein